MKSILILLMIIPSLLSAGIYSAKVVDEEGKPLPGALVQNLRTTEHAHSNELGNFQFMDNTIGDSLRVSLLGYGTVIFQTQETDEVVITMMPISLDLDEVVIQPGIDATALFTAVDLQAQPVENPQELLQRVPGLFIGKHAGGGKAEQIFLRGFDIDHGTDIKITVDGMPVNMVSHAHGQGYADLHFLIPELVEEIAFGKGAYQAAHGNFATAGYVDFQTKEKLDQNSIALEVGQFNSQKVTSLFNLYSQEKGNGYVGLSFKKSDGYFESPQGFTRFNVFAKGTHQLNVNHKLGISISHFQSQWDASGQIPNRAVEQGQITEFGFIDDTEGGQTMRTDLRLKLSSRISENTYLVNQASFSRYAFELYSNFTFYLEDSINGDQIKQQESRDLIHLRSDLNHYAQMGSVPVQLKAGVEVRSDMVNDNELSRTKNRSEQLEAIQFGDVQETNLAGYLSASFRLNKFTVTPGVRLDVFDFVYRDKLDGNYQMKKSSSTIASPKLAVLFDANESTQLYAKFGKGFHSNDTRLVLSEENGRAIPSSYGGDLGVILRPVNDLFINVGIWKLALEDELVYVGDAGIVERSGRTMRDGADLSIRYQPFSFLYLRGDANYTLARSIDEVDGEDYIPLAPGLTTALGAHFNFENGLFLSVDGKHIADRPANEDNSIVAEGYTLFDMSAGYSIKNFSFEFVLENVLNTSWKETQFATTSRLQEELVAVEEIHFIPGAPRNLRGTVKYSF